MRLQVTVDDLLGTQLQTKAHELGFSVSSYVRYLLKNAINKPSKIELALAEIERGEVESLTLEEFKRQIEELKNGS
ncbi:MAG: hypothetical protein ACK4M7_02965 [Burkholderiales bacterium]